MAVNTLYMDGGVLKSARKTFNSQSPRNIRLEKFFQAAIFSILQNKLENLNYKLKFHPYKYKYFTAKSNEINSFLNGRYFKNIIENIIGLKNYKIKYEIRKFESGNYTLLHDAGKDKPGIDFVIDFSKSNENYGGFTVYLTETEELLQLNPSSNALSFIERNKDIMKYTKYVQNRQRHPILQIAGTIF